MLVLKKIMAGLLLPPASLVLLALLGLWAMRSKRPFWKRCGALTVTASLVLLLLLSMPLVGRSLLASLEAFPPISAERARAAQAIVVLAGGKYAAAPEYGGIDTVNHYSLERLRYAAKLAKETGLPLLVTGGILAGERPEADAIRDVLANEFSVPVRWVESRALDTADNARFSAPMLKSAGIGKILLVSHAWHLARAVPLFEREGLQVIPAPTRFTLFGPGWGMLLIPGDFRDARLAAHEYLGRLADQLAARLL